MKSVYSAVRLYMVNIILDDEDDDDDDNNNNNNVSNIIDWRLHNEELNDLYSSLKILRVIKSGRMRWAGHVARMGEEAGCVGSWWGNRRERDPGET